MPMAITGHNGDNESFIGFSSSIGLSLYDDSALEIKIQLTNSQPPIDMVIQRDSSISQSHPYQYVNISQIQLTTGYFFLPNAL